MLRSALGKLMWAGKATVFMMGLALMLALIFGMASTALGANNDNFILGVLNNTATAVTKLTGNVSGGPALQVANPNTATGSRGLQVNVAEGKAPILVNATAGKALNLNADKVDGHDAPLWAVVAADGTGLRGSGFILNSSFRPNPQNRPGEYLVGFDRDISNCSYTATIYRNRSGFVPEGSMIETDNQGPTDTTRIAVFTYDKAGNEAARAFHVQVIC